MPYSKVFFWVADNEFENRFANFKMVDRIFIDRLDILVFKKFLIFIQLSQVTLKTLQQGFSWRW